MRYPATIIAAVNAVHSSHVEADLGVASQQENQSGEHLPSN